MSASALSSLAAALLSLAFSYIPGLADWYQALGHGIAEDGSPTYDGGTRKRLVMLALLVLVAGGAFGLACTGWGDLLSNQGLQLNCQRQDFIELAQALVFAIMANQSVHRLTPARRGPSGEAR